MQRDSLRLWAAAGISAGLMELPFPLAGPMPVWRSIFAWFGIVPLLYGILINSTVECPHPLRRAFLAAYVCGVLWYIGNCYWIRDTMMRYGDMPAVAPVLLLLGWFRLARSLGVDIPAAWLTGVAFAASGAVVGTIAGVMSNGWYVGHVLAPILARAAAQEPARVS